MAALSIAQVTDRDHERPAVPAAAGLRVTADDIGELLDALGHPTRLRQILATIAADAPGVRLPDVLTIHEDLAEALRRARAATGDAAARRYRSIELLLIDRLTPLEAAREQHLSKATFYRSRREATEELAVALHEVWMERAAVEQQTVVAEGGSEPIPYPPIFVGRSSDLVRAGELLTASRLLVIGGPAGIGKTSFGAMLARQESVVHPVLWHRIRPGLTDSVGGVLFAIGRRLAELGADALLAFLRQTSTTSPWQVLAGNLAAHGIAQTELAMFFDDAETLMDNAEVCALLSSIHASCEDARIVLLAKTRMPLLPEAARFELPGLETEAIHEHLAAHGLADLPGAVLESLTHETGGSPQLLHLATGALLHGDLSPEQFEGRLLDVADVRAFFFDQIYSRLSQGEQLVLGAAALVREAEETSFLEDALDGLTAGVPAKLAELGRRFLITAGSDGLRLHSSVRELARRMLSRTEMAELHARLARAYERAGRPDEACHHHIEAGDLGAARADLLACRPDPRPHKQMRLLTLVERLYAAGLTDDPELLRFAAHLTTRERPRRGG